MEEVFVISYLFNIVGQHSEIHTEIRAFGFDFWFEKDGAKAEPATAKERLPEWGYTLDRIISAGYTTKSHNDFEKFLTSVSPDYTAAKYQLFSKNCREYSQKLLTELEPDNARDAKLFLASQNLDAKVKGDLINMVGGAVSSAATNYFLGRVASQNCDSNQKSCWDENQWDTKWSNPGQNTDSGPSPSGSSGPSGTTNQSSENDSQSDRRANRATFVDTVFQAIDKEKPKDTAGWIEFGVQSFASWKRNSGNT